MVLVDDHTLFRRGLAELLEHSGAVSVVGITGNPDEARRLLREQQPDVVMMDLNMPARDGISLLKDLRGEGIDTPVVFLTVSNAERDLAAALRAGARGYLLKDMEPDDVVDAVRRAARGETVVAPAMTAQLVNLVREAQHPRVAAQPVDRPYELHIAETGQVETRPRNWHDLFNALAWIAFPKAKAAINAQMPPSWPKAARKKPAGAARRATR